MEKENGEGGDGGKPPPDGMLDPSGLFGAYWGRDAGSAGGSAAAAAQAQAQAQAALFGFGSRYPPPTTLGVAANQAASLGLHPAASAAWWSMASHLAAQDYLHRLQASGLNFPPMGDPYSAMSALSGLGMKQAPKSQSKSSKGNDRSGRSSASSSSAPSKEKPPPTSTPSPHPSMRSSSYGFPKTSSPSSHHSQASMSSLASLNNMVSSHQGKPSSSHNKPSTSHSSASRKPSSSSSSSSSKDMKNRSLDLLRGDLMLAQAAAQGAYHAAVAAAAKGKNMSSLYPFGMPGTEKGRHGIDSLTGLPHNILSAALEGGDPASVLGGVRLPPDTEIIKYTSSLGRPKAPPGTTNRGRKKTISLDPPSVSVHPSTGDRSTPLPNKRPKVDDYSGRSSVEVIRLPNRDRMAAGLNETPPPNLSDYAGISRELLQTIASQSGVSLAALEKQLAGTAAAVAGGAGSGMNLSKKSSRGDSPMDLGPKSSSAGDDDAPLNLSLKPAPPSNKASDALSCLTSLSSSLSASNNDRISRRKPGAKPRRVMPEMNPNVSESPRPKSSGSEDSESVSSWPSRESRPRNLGRGVSKPKKNTVASLLAQSRALGLRPALAQQLLAETDLEKLKALLGEAGSTDSECLSDSCPSDSDASESGRPHTRLPLALGWKRTTLIRGLSRNCNIKGDVTYHPPEPHSSIKLRSAQELHNYLESNPCPPLTIDNFSFSGRLVLGDYVQASMEPNGEPFTCDEEEITKRLEEARALAALTGPRPTPPPVDRRLELARRQQAARDARRDATTHRSRDQARLVRELERNERADVVKREKEARSQQLLEHINKNRTQLTIEPLPISKTDIDVSQKWRTPEFKPQKDRTMPPISLTLIPINTPKDKTSPTKVINLDQKNWKTDLEQYNALDKMRYFAEKAAFDSPKRKDFSFDFTLTKAERAKAEKLKENIDNKENSLAKLIETYSRIGEFIDGCDWSKLKPMKTNETPKDIEMKYLDAKNEYMTENLMLLPKEAPKSVLKEVIDLSTEDDNVLNDIISKKINKGTFSFGKDGALSISVHPSTSTKDYNLTKRRKHDDHEKVKIDEQFKRQQEREIKRQQAMLLKEQQKYINEERERRRQHTSFIRQLDARRRWEERERRKHQNLLDRLLVKEKKLQQRRKEMELLAELRRPQEDSTLSDQKPMPPLNRIPGLKLPAEAMANLLQVVEFLHNFGRTLGFDVDNLPTLNSFQLGLLPECSIEDEQEVVQILTQLLVCAIEDPGIPHPGRHTTLLGHAIRMGDITEDNISEVLRIYLYANATGEVKTLTGLSVERERERRIPDHHQTDAEMQQACANTKNLTYYEHLHNNSTYKLSEHLRDKPFLALNPTIKTKILAYLCDELLQNKAVLRQIDAGLDNLNQLKKERYLMDMKIRKFRVMCQRKMRAEQTEKQQALALERMQRMVEESSTYTNSLHQHDEEQSQQSNEKTTDQKEQDNDTAIHSESEREKETTASEPTPSPKDRHDESDKELSPLKEVSNSMKTKGLLNNNKDEGSPGENLKDKDSVMGDCDAGLSDLESEGTQPEEDEDKSLTAEELGRKLDKLLRQSELQLQQLAAAQHALRPTHLGQDRYWRRYWSLGKCGGIFVESMESAQPEIMAYQQHLQLLASDQAKGSGKKAGGKNVKEKKETTDMKTEIDAGAEALKSELELKNIKSELNLSDHTQIIKYEANVKSNTCKTSGSSIKMEEKFIQHKQTNEEEDMLDIEDSIPTAFLVQKPSHKPLYAGQPEAVEKAQEILKVENLVKNEIAEPKPEPEDVKDDLVNNLEELRKMAEAVSSQLEAAKKEEEKVKLEQKVVKSEQDAMAAQEILFQKMVEGKWFSILRHENSILNNINETQEKTDKPPVYIDNEHTCAEVVTVQGHKWDVSNNLHLLKDPSIFTLNSMVTAVQVPTNNVYLDSSLTMSGLDQDIIDSTLKEPQVVIEETKEPVDDKLENDLDKEMQQDALKAESIQRAKANNLISLGVLNFNALSTYVTCDSPPPIQMSLEEIEQLEHCKVNGLPKKIEGNFVPKELRHGWWRITEPDQLREVLDALHPRGVRERELLAACLQQIPTINNKLYIDPGDTQYTELQISNLDRVISQNGGYPSPDAPNSFSAVTARRKDMKVVDMVEQLEGRLAGASMIIQSYGIARMALSEEAKGAEIVSRARQKLAVMEAHIERRYLKPPFVQRYANTAEASLGTAMNAEHGSSSSSPHNSDNTETKEKGVSRSLLAWREAVSRCNTSAQLAQVVTTLESHVAWDKSIMKANCQFCLCGDNEDQLLLCDGCDKGYHTYCFKPRMDKIPEGDWYCWECVNKARGDKVCIVCGGTQVGRVIPCTLCPRAYHQDCHYPPLPKNPRGKWYCVNCISRAPPKKPRNTKKRDSKGTVKDTSSNVDDMVPSPAPSHASTSTTTEECNTMHQTPEKMEPERFEHENGLSHTGMTGDVSESETGTPEKKRSLHYGGNGAISNDLHSNDSEPMDTEEAESAPPSRPKKEKNSAKRIQKELEFCKNLLCEMECHEHAWPFLLPVNTKQFPQYKKVIKSPMDLSTIKKKLHDNSYKTKDDFANDVRLIFSNCEEFNEDDSPVGRAGHSMRQFFQEKWAQIN